MKTTILLQATSTPSQIAHQLAPISAIESIARDGDDREVETIAEEEKTGWMKMLSQYMDPKGRVVIEIEDGIAKVLPRFQP